MNVKVLPTEVTCPFCKQRTTQHEYCCEAFYLWDALNEFVADKFTPSGTLNVVDLRLRSFLGFDRGHVDRIDIADGIAIAFAPEVKNYETMETHYPPCFTIKKTYGDLREAMREYGTENLVRYILSAATEEM